MAAFSKTAFEQQPEIGDVADGIGT